MNIRILLLILLLPLTAAAQETRDYVYPAPPAVLKSPPLQAMVAGPRIDLYWYVTRYYSSTHMYTTMNPKYVKQYGESLMVRDLVATLYRFPKKCKLLNSATGKYKFPLRADLYVYAEVGNRQFVMTWIGK